MAAEFGPHPAGCGSTVTGANAVSRVEPFVSRETVVLFSICLLDALTSAYLFHHQLAVEGNPVLRGAAEAGMFAFLSAKTVTFLPALVFAEWYRRRRPGFVEPLLRWAAGVYVAAYVILVGIQLPR
jgi:hypothetical protein